MNGGELKEVKRWGIYKNSLKKVAGLRKSRLKKLLFLEKSPLKKL
jgi:hypothetical protein